MLPPFSFRLWLNSLKNIQLLSPGRCCKELSPFLQVHSYAQQHFASVSAHLDPLSSKSRSSRREICLILIQRRLTLAADQPLSLCLSSFSWKKGSVCCTSLSPGIPKQGYFKARMSQTRTHSAWLYPMHLPLLSCTTSPRRHFAEGFPSPICPSAEGGDSFAPGTHCCQQPSSY